MRLSSRRISDRIEVANKQPIRTKSLTIADFKKIALCRQIRKFKASFFELSHLPLNDLFPSELITKIIARSRDKVFTPLVTLKTFIFQVLCEDGSCKPAVVSLLTERLQLELSPNFTNTGPYRLAIA